MNLLGTERSVDFCCQDFFFAVSRSVLKERFDTWKCRDSFDLLRNIRLEDFVLI